MQNYEAKQGLSKMNWKDLKVWNKSHNLAKNTYKIVSSFPDEEKYGLISQIKRAAVSIPTNIVEGFARNTTKEYILFLFNSRGSLEELRYLALLSFELDFLSDKDYKNIEESCEGISKMLNALIKKLRERI
jgi:four helix bundle protein